jgi:hypothetical protein
MFKKQMIEQNKCSLDIPRFYTLAKGGRGVSVVHHGKTKWIAIIVDKVVPRVSERTKHGPIPEWDKRWKISLDAPL